MSTFQREQVLPAGFYWRTSRSIWARARAEWSFAAAAELDQDVGQCEPVPVLNAYIRLGKQGVGFVACSVQRKVVAALLVVIVLLSIRPETE